MTYDNMLYNLWVLILILIQVIYEYCKGISDIIAQPV